MVILMFQPKPSSPHFGQSGTRQSAQTCTELVGIRCTLNNTIGLEIKSTSAYVCAQTQYIYCVHRNGMFSAHFVHIAGPLIHTTLYYSHCLVSHYCNSPVIPSLRYNSFPRTEWPLCAKSWIQRLQR